MRPNDQQRLTRICTALHIPVRVMGQWILLDDTQMFSQPEAAARWIIDLVAYDYKLTLDVLRPSTRQWLTRQSLIDAPVVKRKYHRRAKNA